MNGSNSLDNAMIIVENNYFSSLTIDINGINNKYKFIIECNQFENDINIKCSSNYACFNLTIEILCELEQLTIDCNNEIGINCPNVIIATISPTLEPTIVPTNMPLFTDPPTSIPTFLPTMMPTSTTNRGIYIYYNQTVKYPKQLQIGVAFSAFEIATFGSILNVLGLISINQFFNRSSNNTDNIDINLQDYYNHEYYISSDDSNNGWNEGRIENFISCVVFNIHQTQSSECDGYDQTRFEQSEEFKESQANYVAYVSTIIYFL